MDKLPEIALENLEETAQARLEALLHSSNVEKIEYSNATPEGEVAQAIDIYIGEPSPEDGHILVSTFGSGASETKGTVSIEGEETPYRSEFFAVANSHNEAVKLAGRLAKLAFIVDAHQEGFIPGMIIDGLGEENELSHTYLSETPLGSLGNHAVEPILTEEFLLFWIAVTPISEEEAKALATGPEFAEGFMSFANSQGVDFYSSMRNLL